MAKLYKVKLAQGFNAAGRVRAGITLQKGVTQIVALDKEQLEALQADVWIDVAEAPEGSVADESSDVAEKQAEDTAEAEEQAADDAAEEAGSDLPEAGDLSDEEKADVNEEQAESTAEAENEAEEDAEEIDLSTKSIDELRDIAKEVGLSNRKIKKLKTEEELILAIEESQKTEE